MLITFESKKNLSKELKKKVCRKETTGNKADFKKHKLPQIIKNYKEIEKWTRKRIAKAKNKFMFERCEEIESLKSKHDSVNITAERKATEVYRRKMTVKTVCNRKFMSDDSWGELLL